MGNIQSTQHRESYHFVWIFLLLAVAIVVTGLFYYQNYQHRFRKEVESQLSAIVELKSSELDRWRKDRLEHDGTPRGETSDPFRRGGL